jgi:hypothetical protein
VIDAAEDADERALARHAYFWEPWFARWGGAFAVPIWRTRPRCPNNSEMTLVRAVRERRVHGIRDCPEIAWRPVRRPRSIQRPRRARPGTRRKERPSRERVDNTAPSTPAHGLERAAAPARRPSGRTGDRGQGGGVQSITVRRLSLGTRGHASRPVKAEARHGQPRSAAICGSRSSPGLSPGRARAEVARLRRRPCGGYERGYVAAGAVRRVDRRAP